MNVVAVYLLIGFGVVGYFLTRWWDHFHIEIAREAARHRMPVRSVLLVTMLVVVGFALVWPLALPALALSRRR